jgi:hypothetical protein
MAGAEIDPSSDSVGAGQAVGPRPRGWLSSVQFSDGSELNLARHEVLIFVGPNNSGKSVALRDILNKISEPGSAGLAITRVTVEIEGDDESALRWAETLPRKSSIASNPNAFDLPFGRINRQTIDNDWRSARRTLLQMRLTRHCSIYMKAMIKNSD